jgi:hypothetical protein
MPKTKTRRRGKGKSDSTRERAALATQASAPSSGKAGRSRSKTPQSRNTQNLVMAAMIALGCWGMAISFIFFTTDPNRYLWGGLAALIAIMWSSLVGMRVRNILRQDGSGTRS